MGRGNKRSLSDKWRLTSLSNKVITSATVVIAFAGVLTFGAAFFQWREMRDAGVQTNKIIAADERLAGAMEKSVSGAGKSLQATIDNFHLEQRAWVGPVAVIQPEFKETDSFSITTLISNSGKTPALNFRNKYSWLMMSKEGKFQPSYRGYQGVPSSGTIFPNGQLNLISSPTILRKQQIDLVVSGKTVLYVYGELLYDDVFGQTHHTHFCNFYDKTLKPGVCGIYNDED